MARHLVFLGFLTVILAYAVYSSGGTEETTWNTCLLALGLVSLWYWLQAGKRPMARMGRWLAWPAVLLPCYVALQLVPLPVAVVEVLSPARAELARALAPVVPHAGFATLSVAPAATLAQFLRITGYAVLFFLLYDISRGWPKGEWMVAAPVVLIAGLEAALGLAQYGAGGADSPGRGTYTNRDHYAGLLEMALPFALALALAGFERARSAAGGGTRLLLRAYAGLLAACLIFAGLIYSLSRMGFVASLVSLVAMGVLIAASSHMPLRAKWLTAAGAAALVIASFIFFPPGELISRFRRPVTQEAMEGRAVIWREMLPLIRAYPLFGCGLGGFESAFLKYKFSAPMLDYDYAHNDYLQLLAELGILGFLAGAALMLAVFRRAIRLAFARDELELRWLGPAAAASMLAIGIHSLADFNMYIPANALALAWICGITAGLSGRSERVSEHATG